MPIFSIIPVIFFIIILFLVISIIRNISAKKSLAESSFQIALSYDDLLRQIFLVMAIIIGLTALYAGIHSFGWNLAWYWIATIGGIISTYFGYKQHSPILFITGLLMATVGVTFGAYEVASNHKIDRGLSYMSAFLIFGSLYGLSVSFFTNNRAKRYYTVLHLLGILGLGGVTFFLGSFGAREVWGYITNNDSVIWSNVKTSLILLGAIILFIISYFKSFDYFIKNKYQIIVTGISIFGAGLVLLLPKVSLLYEDNQVYTYSENNWAEKNLEVLPHIISMNVLFLSLVGWLLYSAYKLKEIWRLNLAILAMFLFILFRYFDWVERTELNRSLFFLGFGIIFLITGWVLERFRRNILASMDN
jgi:hypothetical protein